MENFEKKMEEQATNAGKVQTEAVTLAKENMKKKKLEEDARMVESRLREAERCEEKAIKDGRFASKKRNIMKEFSGAISAAKTRFEATGDWQTYDKEATEASNEKSKKIREAAEEVYGKDAAWRYCD